MSGPFIVVSKSRIKPGKAEAYALWYTEFCRFVEENEPRLLAFNHYETEDRTTLRVVQVHPDAESMEYHLKLYQERAGETADYGEVLGVEIFGQPSEQLAEWLTHGIKDLPVTVTPVHTAGFTRLQGA
jgi:hypothetical protein